MVSVVLDGRLPALESSPLTDPAVMPSELGTGYGKSQKFSFPDLILSSGTRAPRYTGTPERIVIATETGRPWNGLGTSTESE